MTARVQVAARVCESCGAEFERRTYGSGRLEDATRFAKRRFCSRACYRKAAADGCGSGLLGVWVHGPHQPTANQGASDGGAYRQVTRGFFPWDRARAPRPLPNSGPFSAGREMQFPESDSIKKGEG